MIHLLTVENLLAFGAKWPWQFGIVQITNFNQYGSSLSPAPSCFHAKEAMLLFFWSAAHVCFWQQRFPALARIDFPSLLTNSEGSLVETRVPSSSNVAAVAMLYDLKRSSREQVPLKPSREFTCRSCFRNRRINLKQVIIASWAPTTAVYGKYIVTGRGQCVHQPYF